MGAERFLEQVMCSPDAPTCFLTDWGRSLFISTQFEEFSHQIFAAQRARESANRQARELVALVESAKIFRENGDLEQYQTRIDQITTTTKAIEAALGEDSLTGEDDGVRPSFLAEAMEAVVRLKAFDHFLNHGVVLPRSTCHEFFDEEYLAGLMSMTHELSRYALGRAINQDITSVKMARNVIEALQFEFSKFDFRNGPLRRKFDGVKYSLKRLEGIVYDLTINDKRPKLESNTRELPSAVINVDEFDTIRKRMEHIDEMREVVIKRCRDIQKNSKQAIYSLHRKQYSRAEEQLKVAVTGIEELLPTVALSRALRYGAFTSSLEEYTEARLFQLWLSERRLVPKSAVPFVNADEYIGALSDFTGELGRFAVASATQRDISTVKQCLETDAMIAFQLSQLPLSAKLNKKIEPVRQAVLKLENIIYELSLSNNAMVWQETNDVEHV
eukprot:c4582_g1_i1.p1 GENE.c4582_g1_i1~~c4582_g1_i1.p1  ORF type:complete len:444 (-),score=121.33 c4582_g1_i1:863-2194(-)